MDGQCENCRKSLEKHTLESCIKELVSQRNEFEKLLHGAVEMAKAATNFAESAANAGKHLKEVSRSFQRIGDHLEKKAGNVEFVTLPYAKPKATK